MLLEDDLADLVWIGVVCNSNMTLIPEVGVDKAQIADLQARWEVAATLLVSAGAQQRPGHPYTSFLQSSSATPSGSAQ